MEETTLEEANEMRRDDAMETSQELHVPDTSTPLKPNKRRTCVISSS